MKESRRSFLQKSVATSAGFLLGPAMVQSKENEKPPVINTSIGKEEWRNKQEGMTYRKLGNTGFLVSEIIMGTFPYQNEEYIPLLDAGIEKGMNYLDTAYAYGSGKSEQFIGDYLKHTGSREKLFISTKLSAYYNYINGVVDEILKGLPQGKKNELEKKSQKLISERRVKLPGYHINYFGGQDKQYDTEYMRYTVLKEYGFKKEWRKKIKARGYELLEGSLKRLQTDYVDVLHCPHGVAMPEMLDDEVLQELFGEFKQKGMIRAAAVSFHNDVTANLAKAIEVGYYDVSMFAYNIANHAALENMVYKANQAGLGLVAMKVARTFSIENSPQWRLDKLNSAISDTGLSKHAKAYLWALQNESLSCCVSQMETIAQVEENYSITGKKVTINGD